MYNLQISKLALINNLRAAYQFFDKNLEID
jgi:hypothetical protein